MQHQVLCCQMHLIILYLYTAYPIHSWTFDILFIVRRLEKWLSKPPHPHIFHMYGIFSSATHVDVCNIYQDLSIYLSDNSFVLPWVSPSKIYSLDLESCTASYDWLHCTRTITVMQVTSPSSGCLDSVNILFFCTWNLQVYKIAIISKEIIKRILLPPVCMYCLIAR